MDKVKVLKIKVLKIKAISAKDTIFTALGFDLTRSANVCLRAELMVEIEALIKTQKLAQVAAARLFGVSQPRVNNLLQGRIDLFIVDTLGNWLSKLDKHVELVSWMRLSFYPSRKSNQRHYAT